MDETNMTVDELRKKELVDKLNALIAARFGGSVEAAFRYYDKDGDGRLDGDDVDKLLQDASVGNFITRHWYVKGILEAVDKDQDGKIMWIELQEALKQ